PNGVVIDFPRRCGPKATPQHHPATTTSDKDAEATIYREMAVILEARLPDLSEASTAKPHLERALRTLRLQLGWAS
ncbi:MAG TPA: hypothetical protein VES79_12115, partial [Solirubrobacteraceae bacterium]|nr:hypothetical protein [Solirubrobacteraceae bacterium]